MSEKKLLVTRSSMPPFEEYAEMIKPLWESRWLTNMGEYHRMFEKEIGDYLESRVSLTVNGHMALELAIQSMNFPAGSEVITTPFTFISTTHAIVRNGLTPVFCDIGEDFTIDVSKIENLITERTAAIVPVHVYGNICNVEEIERIAFKYGLKVIYDAAHAFGERYHGRSIAQYGDMSIFSFHATKVFHSIEGGAVCCRTNEQYETLYNLKNFGIRSEELTVGVGANAKMNEFQAAMGLCNLKYITQEIGKRKLAVERYQELLAGTDGLWLNRRREDVESNYAYFPILFEDAEQRDVIYQKLREHEIYARKYFYPLTADAACFKNKYRNANLKRARYVTDRILTLPLYADITEEEQNRVVSVIKEGMAQGRMRL